MLKNQISRKTVQWEPSCSMRTDGHRTKLTVAFRNFADAPKKLIKRKLPVTLTQEFLSAHFHKLQLFKLKQQRKRDDNVVT